MATSRSNANTKQDENFSNVLPSDEGTPATLYNIHHLCHSDSIIFEVQMRLPMTWEVCLH